jgi:glutamate 5-kinase
VTTASDAFSKARKIVVKIGSALLVDADSGKPNHDVLTAIAADVARIRADDRQVLIVSSGSIALGRRALGLKKSASLPEKQAAASVGQSLLMRAWEAALSPHAITCAQILLTPDDTEVRSRWLNGRATLETLLALKAVPVINENDTVATEEIRYGDNDRLAARVAQMIGADGLVLLSDIDGLYTADPRSDPSAQHLPVIETITSEILAMAGGVNAAANVGSGGMATKLAAAQIAAHAGCFTIITRGDSAVPLQGIETAAALNTIFHASGTPAAAYKTWIAGSLKAQGVLVVDDGAAKALSSGKSLLAAGVQSVEGHFAKGDAVLVRSLDGRELAKGLVRYDAEDAIRIKGLRSDAIEAALGYVAGPMIHADDLSR